MSTRQIATTALAFALALALGWIGRGLLDAGHDRPAGTHDAPTDDGPCPGGAAPLYWKAPMDPTFVRDAPGKSPMGMDLVPECPRVGNAGRPGDVVIDAGTLQNIGVRTAAVERRDLSRAVRAVGRVAYDERRVVHVHTKVQGWIEKLSVEFVGQTVRRGEPLLEIYSPELVATQEELLLAARYRDATEDSPFEDVRGGGASLFSATKRRLALWDIRESDVERTLRTGKVERTLTLHAPASGVVMKLGVRAGMEVAPNTNLYTIADLSKLWVLADVYEYELPWLALGQRARVELSYMPDAAVTGVLSYIAPFLDPKTRTAQVRLEVDNADGALKPEMFANVVIEASPRAGVLAIPSEAVLRSGTRSLAIVSRGDGHFEPRDLALGIAADDGWTEVTSGLAERERVVVSSQFLIDSESKLREAVQKLLSSGDGDAPGSTRAPEPDDSMNPHDHSAHGKE